MMPNAKRSHAGPKAPDCNRDAIPALADALCSQTSWMMPIRRRAEKHNDTVNNEEGDHGCNRRDVSQAHPDRQAVPEHLKEDNPSDSDDAEENLSSHKLVVALHGVVKKAIAPIQEAVIPTTIREGRERNEWQQVPLCDHQHRWSFGAHGFCERSRSVTRRP